MYRLRFLRVMLQSFWSRKRALHENFPLTFWAIPLLDTDVSRLFTQTYAQYMGLARWNLVFNSEFRTAALQRGWTPVTTRETITYRRSIKAFERVRLVTRIVHWNAHRFYMEQTFMVRGDVRAVCYVEGVVRGPKGVLSPTDVFRELGVQRVAPSLPEELRRWVATDKEPSVPRTETASPGGFAG